MSTLSQRRSETAASPSRHTTARDPAPRRATQTVASPKPVRAALVARAKRLLAEGYYDNTHVLDMALSRLIDEMVSPRPPAPRPRPFIPGRHATRRRPK